MKTLLVVLAVVMVITTIGMLVIFKIADQDKSVVWTLARQKIEKRLKYPGSADYGEQTANDCVSSTGKDKYYVRGWVNVSNGFGAKSRYNFSVDVRRTKEHVWIIHVVKLEEWN